MTLSGLLIAGGARAAAVTGSAVGCGVIAAPRISPTLLHLLICTHYIYHIKHSLHIISIAFGLKAAITCNFLYYG